MSIEVPKVEETAPVTKPVQASETPAVVSTETPVVEPITEAPKETTESAAAAQETAKDETVVEATPASEGILGYKEPGFLKQFRFSKYFFWFSEEALTKDALASYLRSEKTDVAHSHSAWAQETGKGVLFYAKRAEDRAHPAGLILLADASAVTKVGTHEISFKIGEKTHKFEAATPAERDSWIVALESKIEESKGLKEEITGRESYKKTVEDFAKAPVAVVPVAATKTEKKSLDLNKETAAAEPTANAETSSNSSSDEEKKAKKAEKKAEKEAAKKERSQSRKRNSVFGIFGKKDEEKKEEKAEKKEEKKLEKEAKKVEAEQKKEEAKQEHDASKAKEAAEAAAVAAAPAAVLVAADKKEEKTEEKTDATSPTDKKAKRTSVFGGLFAKKAHGPSTEKSEKETGVAVPAKDTEVPPVSETAPKLDEPIETKPIDTAAVTAPVDAPEASTAATTSEEPAKDAAVSPATETTATPKTEKKGFLAGLIKKHDKKEEAKEEKKEEKAAEEISKDPLAAAAPITTEAATTDATESATKESEAAKDERPAREKRRTSLFGSLGTMKRKSDKSPAPESATTETTTEATEVKETKREKSPMPSKLGSLFRKPSKAVKSEKATESKETETAATEATKVNGETPVAASTTVVEPTESKIVGDVVPEELTTTHDAVTTKPEEVKASA